MIMNQNINIDDKLVKQALAISKSKTQSAVIEEALRLFIQINRQLKIRNLRGKLSWEGNLNEMRLDE